MSPQVVAIISDASYPYIARWSAKRLLPGDGYLAFDTETDVVDLKRQIPRLALASASAGDKSSCLIHPDDLGRFIQTHKGLHFVCHNAAFDFWVVAEHLKQRGEDDAHRVWWAVARSNRLHDSMLLDMLVRLAKDDSYPDPRDLAVVAKTYAGVEISKEDPYRKRYGEIIGVDWAAVEPGFFDYAVKDAIVTRLAYREIREQAKTLASNFPRGDIQVDARQKFGLLTEAVQVKKAIALAQITRNGMTLDLESLRRAEDDLRRRRDEAVAAVRALCPDLYRTDKDGKLVLAGKAKAPSKRADVLGKQLEQVVERVKEDLGVELRVPHTSKKKQLSTSKELWQDYQDHDPFLRHWINVESLAKLLQFFSHLREAVVHPRYSTLVRTGRTSCKEPNVQQIPRDASFRQAFVASPGHLLLAADYSFIELRTLAAHTLYRYHWSDMANVIKAGTDPHAYTGAMMAGVPLDEFLGWKGNETEVGGQMLKDQFDKARQAAKAINFGVPGGLGAQRLMDYARNTYKVNLTLEQAKERRELLTKKVYKELDLYLDEDAVAIVANNLRVPVDTARAELGDTHLSSVSKILTGDPRRLDGKPYEPTFVSRVWSSLAGLNRNPELTEALKQRRPSPELAARVCQAGVATLTGRIRGRVRYSQARNTPFQGLAADGAALALFALIDEGFRVVGFIHDEILVELPDEGGHVSEAKVRRVEEIMCRAMESVLVGNIPVACEAALSRRWHKKAKLIVRDGKVYPWEENPGGQDGPAAGAA
jgi:DNA polymerase I-like protein with 3'-5' exonuclease and polymerase domains